jgi:hypothetical protein
MARPTAVKGDSDPPDGPVNLGDRAIDNLKYIRETMERSTSFTAVPGYGGIVMGLTAIVAAYVANNYAPLRQDWLITWLIEACVAFAIGLGAMWYKASRDDASLFSVPAKTFALSFTPPLIVGAAITVGLWRFGHFEVMVPVWILCYGASVVCGGAFSVRVVPVMGWCFIACGAIAYVMPAGWGNIYMAATFGVLHIIFGAVIGKKYGG